MFSFRLTPDIGVVLEGQGRAGKIKPQHFVKRTKRRSTSGPLESVKNECIYCTQGTVKTGYQENHPVKLYKSTWVHFTLHTHGSDSTEHK